MLLELKRGGRKGVGKGQRRVLVRTNVRGEPHRSIGGSLALAPALDMHKREVELHGNGNGINLRDANKIATLRI